SRQRPVEPPQRLDPDEVAQDEHVERDLQPELRLDLRCRVRLLARLVVLDDPARAERIDVDPVDLPREEEAAEVEAALQLRRRAFRAERDLEPARNQPCLGLDLRTDELLEIAPEPLLELVTLQVGEVES